MLHFGLEFVRNPRAIGAIAPSSRGLATRMIDAIEIARHDVIVEFGPGSGAFTRHIRAALRPGQRYIGIEINPRFIGLLRHAYPDLDFVHGSVEDVAALMAGHGVHGVGAVVCGLPWASLPETAQGRTFAGLRTLLTPASVFCTFAYLQGLLLPGGQALRRRLRTEFGSVTTSPVVWGNLPPAFVYVCRDPLRTGHGATPPAAG